MLPIGATLESGTRWNLGSNRPGFPFRWAVPLTLTRPSVREDSTFVGARRAPREHPTSGNNLRPRVQPWHARLQGEKRYTLPERERFLRRSGLVMHRESKHAAPGVLTVILSVGLAAVCLWAVPASAVRLKCPRDSVKVGNVCIDTYAESVWQIPLPNKSLISAVLAGKATLADLTAGGATQLSPSPSCSPGYPANFP